MKKTLCILIFSFLVLILCTSVYAAVEPVISVNGMTGTVNITPDSPVTVNVKLSPGEKDGTDADWWLVCNAFGKWYYYTLDGKWTDIGETLDIGKLRPTYQGKLFTMQQTDLLHVSQLAAGNYTLYFGVDMNMNGLLDTDSLVFGEVNVEAFGLSGGYGGGSGMFSSTMPEAVRELPGIDAEDLNQPSLTAHSYNIVDFIPLMNGCGVQVIESSEQHILRVVPLSDPEDGQAISELVLDENSYCGAFSDGNMTYLILSPPMFFSSIEDILKHPFKGFTKIQIIDFSTPKSPVKRGSIQITSDYYRKRQAISSVSMTNFFQLDGSVLIFPYIKGKMYEISPGEDPIQAIMKQNQSLSDAEKGITVLDFSDPDNPKAVTELLPDVRDISGYFFNGRMLYVSHSKNIYDSAKGYSMPEYYLTGIDLSNPAKPLISASVNIPSPCIGIDSSGKYIFTMNSEFGVVTFGSAKLGTDSLLNDSVTAQSYDSVSKPIISDGFAYRGGSGITIADISNPEKLRIYEYRLENGSVTILGVKNRKIFADIIVYKPDQFSEILYSGTICYDASVPESLRAYNFAEKFGVGYRIAFSDNNAYVPMGYYGLWVGSLDN